MMNASLVLPYASFKSLITSKALPWQYVDAPSEGGGDYYFIFTYDGPSCLSCLIYKSGFTVEGIDPVQEAANRTDFENNYKPTANASLNPYGSAAVSPALPYGSGVLGWLQSTWERLNAISSSGISVVTGTAGIVKSAEFSISSRTEFDVTGTSYTVGTGKNLYLVFFGGTSDSPSPTTFRLKVGSTVVYKINLGASAGQMSNSFSFGLASKIATAGDVVKITCDPSMAKGTAWTGYTAVEL